MTNIEPPTEFDPPAEVEPRPAAPVSCERLQQEAAERPKSLRLLPRITADAVRLVWAASPRMLIASIALKLVNGAGLAAALVYSRNLISGVLSANTAAPAAAPGIGAVAPQLVIVVGIVAGLGLVTAAGREVREILAETPGWSCPRTRPRRFTTTWCGPRPGSTGRSRWSTG